MTNYAQRQYMLIGVETYFSCFDELKLRAFLGLFVNGKLISNKQRRVTTRVGVVN